MKIMKHIINYLSALLAVVLIGTAFTACADDDAESANVGLGVKVFFPTKVVTNQPMTINGSGFNNVTEIEFPGGVKVSNFEIVGNDMIRVNAPSGISAEGGKIIVRNGGEEAESPQTLTIGSTKVTGFSKQPGEEAGGGELITVYGSDLEFINSVELLDSEGEPQLIDHKDFYRKGTDNLVFRVPLKNIPEDTFVGHLHTYDGKTFDLPELAYKPAADEGHWETVRTTIWKNDGSHGNISWGGDYRFAPESNSTGEEIYTVPQDMWDKMKSGSFYMLASINADWYNMRITTGWWSTTWTGNDIGKGDERIIDNGDGTFFIELNFDGDPILDVLDAQHLLFTGEGYTPLELYFEEDVWVDGPGLQEVKVPVWTNDGSHGNISWNGDYRFAPESNSTGEEIYTVPQDMWDKMKSGKFYLHASINADWYNLRITTGWWSTTWTGADIGKGDERIILNEDGTFDLEIDFSGDPILDVLDAQHLLFTGEGYTPLEIYFIELQGGGGAKEVDFWKNDGSLKTISWNGDYRFSSESSSTGEECYAIPQDIWDNHIMKGTFYLQASADNDWYNLRITTGWWSTTWTGNDIGKGDERLVMNEDGTFTIEMNFSGDPILDVLDAQHLLFTGEGYTPLRLFYIE